MLKELLISSVLFSPPYVKMYDMSDMMIWPPMFDNAPVFSVSLGVSGRFPILTHHPYVRERREKKKFEDIVHQFAEYHEYYNTRIYWYDKTMILSTVPEVHKILERH